MRKHSLWLEHWQGIRIERALWKADAEKAEIHLTETEGNALLFCGIRKEPARFTFTGEKAVMKHEGTDLVFELKGSGILTVDFKEGGK